MSKMKSTHYCLLIIEKYINGEVKRKEFEKYYTDVNPCQKLPLTRRVKKPKRR